MCRIPPPAPRAHSPLRYTTTSVADQPLTLIANFPPAGRKVIAVAVTSFNNSCVVLDNGDLYCWGQMSNQTSAKPVPAKMTNLTGLTNVHSNRQTICPTYSGASNCFDP